MHKHCGSRQEYLCHNSINVLHHKGVCSKHLFKNQQLHNDCTFTAKPLQMPLNWRRILVHRTEEPRNPWVLELFPASSQIVFVIASIQNLHMAKTIKNGVLMILMFFGKVRGSWLPGDTLNCFIGCTWEKPTSHFRVFYFPNWTPNLGIFHQLQLQVKRRFVPLLVVTFRIESFAVSPAGAQHDCRPGASLRRIPL